MISVSLRLPTFLVIVTRCRSLFFFHRLFPRTPTTKKESESRNSFFIEVYRTPCPVGWSSRKNRQHLCWVVRPPPNEFPGYDTKQSDAEVSVMLEVWGMQSTPSLPSFLGPLCSGEIAPDRVLSMGQIELKCVLMLNWITWNRTVLTFNCVWIKSILILNWFVWIRTVWLNWIAWNRNVFTIKLWTHAKPNFWK